jgi:DNA (cytosine-5)-methyltransferase 1
MTNEKEIKYFSTFSGIGGFELGIEKALSRGGLGTNGKEDIRLPRRQEAQHGTRNDSSQTERPNGRSLDSSYPVCVGYSELDKYAVQIYQSHFPTHRNWGDITKINERELPDFDLLVGGFPCQAFSIAGKRGGFSDTRGTLFFDLARILRAKQPRLFLFENVKGLLSHDEGRTLRTIISTLDELGYDLQWQVLNSKDFGVPQNRERIFIAGHLRGTPRPEVFPLIEADRATDPRFNESDTEVASTLRSRYGNGSGSHLAVGTLRTHKDGEGFREVQSGLAPTIPARAREDGSGQGVIKQGMQIRRLTPVECERLQGFPDGWTEGVSDTQRYKTLGNAVTVNVIQAIMNRLLA